jgi:hypothetical protein
MPATGRGKSASRSAAKSQPRTASRGRKKDPEPLDDSDDASVATEATTDFGAGLGLKTPDISAHVVTPAPKSSMYESSFSGATVTAPSARFSSRGETPLGFGSGSVIATPHLSYNDEAFGTPMSRATGGNRSPPPHMQFREPLQIRAPTPLEKVIAAIRAGSSYILIALGILFLAAVLSRSAAVGGGATGVADGVLDTAGVSLWLPQPLRSMFGLYDGRNAYSDESEELLMSANESLRGIPLGHRTRTRLNELLIQLTAAEKALHAERVALQEERSGLAHERTNLQEAVARAVAARELAEEALAVAKEGTANAEAWLRNAAVEHVRDFKDAASDAIVAAAAKRADAIDIVSAQVRS